MFTTLQIQQNKEGKKFHAECMVYPILDKEGDIKEYIHIIRNVSSRIELEEKMKEQLEMKPIDKEKIRAMKELLRKGLDKKLKEKRFIPTPPRYDDVFYEGLAWLDSLK